jgi:hypothetical protein
MCLACAIPVRGAAFGQECIARVLGDEPPDETPSARRPNAVHVVVAFAVAAASTALPWMTSGEGSTAFGAWGRSPRWATVAVVASVAGLLVAAWRVRRGESSRRWDRVLVGLGVATAAAAVLEWFRPPFPSRPSPVPWICAVAAAYATVRAARGVREDARVVP